MIPSIRLYFIWTLVALLPSLGLAAPKGTPSLKPSQAEFREFCAQHRQAAARFKLPTPKLNEVIWVPVHALEASQTRFSFDRVLAAMDKLVKNEGLDEDKGRKKGYQPPHNNGSSFYPKKRKTTGLYYRGKLFILDGHHRALISTYLGAETIPMEVLADWSHKSPDVFLKDMHEYGYSYLMDANGNPSAHRDLCDLLEDPYLMLARKLMLRVDLKFKSDGTAKLLEIRGSDQPIAIKINRDIPFFEFEIADRLRRAGVTWQNGEKISNKRLHEFLEILRTQRESSRFAQVLLLDEPTYVKDLELLEMITDHIKVYNCEHQLMSGDND